MLREAIGIIATCFILFAFTFNGEKRIRIFDAIGAALFIAYGVLIGSFSTILLNGILIAIHIFKLCKISRQPQREAVDLRGE